MDNNNEAPPIVDSYVTPLVVSAVGILFTILILACFFFIFWWHYLRPHHQSPRHDTTNSTISLIKSSNGVPEEILNKIPVVTYSSSSQENDDEASSSGTLVQSECSICLGQFKDEEKLRALPSCRHAFHVPCIDAWFQEHTNCPVCRSPIIACDNCESSSSSALSTDSENGGTQQRVLHVIPIDNHHHQLMDYDDDDDDVTACHSRFQQQQQQQPPHPPVLHRHSHSVSCHMNNKKKPRSLGIRLKRSLSMDQSSLYVAVTIQKDQEDTSSAFSTKGVIMSTRYKSKSLRHLDHVSRVLMRSFSQFRNSGRSSGVLPN